MPSRTSEFLGVLMSSGRTGGEHFDRTRKVLSMASLRTNEHFEPLGYLVEALVASGCRAGHAGLHESFLVVLPDPFC